MGRIYRRERWNRRGRTRGERRREEGGKCNDSGEVKG